MNFAEAFLHERGEALGLGNETFTTLMLTPRFRASSHVVCLLFRPGAAAPTLVAKTPRLLDGRSTLAHEAASLSALQQLRPEGFDSVPKLIAFESFHGRPLLIETALPGPLMEPAHVRAHGPHCCDLISTWLSVLHRSSALPAGSDGVTTLVEEPLERFATRFPVTREEIRLIANTRAMAAPLFSARLPLVFEHGDLSHPNVVVTGRDSVGILDWELARRHGAVAHDLFVFLTYVAFSCSGASTEAGRAAAAFHAFEGNDAWARSCAARYVSQLQVDPTLLRSLFVLCWARYTATLLDRISENTPGTRAIDTELAEWLRDNRYFRLWRLATTMRAAAW